MTEDGHLWAIGLNAKLSKPATVLDTRSRNVASSKSLWGDPKSIRIEYDPHPKGSQTRSRSLKASHELRFRHHTPWSVCGSFCELENHGAGEEVQGPGSDPDGSMSALRRASELGSPPEGTGCQEELSDIHIFIYTHRYIYIYMNIHIYIPMYVGPVCSILRTAWVK